MEDNKEIMEVESNEVETTEDVQKEEVTISADVEEIALEAESRGKSRKNRENKGRNRRRNDGQDDDEKRRKDGIIFLKKISGQIGNERTGISTDKRFPIMRFRIGEVSAQDGASGDTSRIHDRRRDERAFDDEWSTIRIAIFDEVVNLYPHPRHERYRTGNRSE